MWLSLAHKLLLLLLLSRVPIVARALAEPPRNWRAAAAANQPRRRRRRKPEFNRIKCIYPLDLPAVCLDGDIPSGRATSSSFDLAWKLLLRLEIKPPSGHTKQMPADEHKLIALIAGRSLSLLSSFFPLKWVKSLNFASLAVELRLAKTTC